MFGKKRSLFAFQEYRRIVIFLISVSVFYACNKDQEDEYNYLDSPQCKLSFIPKSAQYKVIGFYPSWKYGSMPLSDIPYEKLTRIVYAFAIPNPNGTIDTRDLTMVNELIESAHAHGVEVYFSVGGGNGSSNFPFIAQTEETRKRFVNEVCQFLFENCLDGVDIDWEYWSEYGDYSIMRDESGAFLNILQMLNEKLKPFNLGLTIDVGASHWSGIHFFDGVAASVDGVQVMCYDFSGPWSDPGPHSSYEQSIGTGNTVNSTGLAYWINYRKWPKEKILLGVPFYGRDFDNQGGEGIAYSGIVSLTPDAYLNDKVNNIYYNGIITMSRKTQYVVDNNLPGIMIWEIAQDSEVDSISLLSAIDRTINP